ncbi:hypothetical protein F4811DRAFT_179142 [Daldinia bambusicola]|nr:hypothetical protein F4811DRAFT_179142 [Daldinia bambusicola]
MWLKLRKVPVVLVAGELGGLGGLEVPFFLIRTFISPKTSRFLFFFVTVFCNNVVFFFYPKQNKTKKSLLLKIVFFTFNKNGLHVVTLGSLSYCPIPFLSY